MSRLMEAPLGQFRGELTGLVGVVERNILRLALAELDEGLTPPKVVIAEAVKLAHWFAGSKAPAFVNGVLDAVARELGVL